MYRNPFKGQLFTVPNLLSLLRLTLVPVYARIYLSAVTDSQYRMAGYLLMLSCLTDMLDGAIARHFNQVTDLGKVLDPLADKVTQFTMTLCLSLRQPALRPVLVLLTVKELLQLAAGIYYLRLGQMLPGALTAGKVSTAVLFVSLTVLILFPRLSNPAVKAIALTDCFVLAVAFFSYGHAYFGTERKLRDLEA